MAWERMHECLSAHRTDALSCLVAFNACLHHIITHTCEYFCVHTIHATFNEHNLCMNMFYQVTCIVRKMLFLHKAQLIMKYVQIT